VATKKRAPTIEVLPLARKKKPPVRSVKPSHRAEGGGRRTKRKKASEKAYEEGVQPEDLSRTQLRHYAQMLYVISVDGVTIRGVGKHPMLAHLPEATINNWAAQDQWSEKRRITLEGWKTQIESTIGDELVRSRIQSVRKLQLIRDRLFSKLSPEDHPFTDEGGCITSGQLVLPVCAVCGNTELQHIDPFAGIPGDRAVKALMDLVEMELRLQEMILTVTSTPGYGQRVAAGGARPALPVKASLSTDEIRGAAMAVLRKRREDMGRRATT
jgi:hypothetical protein